MHLIPGTDVLILIIPYGRHYVKAVKLPTITDQSPMKQLMGKLFGNQPPANTMWKLEGIVLRWTIHPDAISSDRQGNVYITDWINNRVLVVNGLTGDVHQELTKWKKGKGCVNHLCCLDNPSQLVVYQTTGNPPGTLSLYNITPV